MLNTKHPLFAQEKEGLKEDSLVGGLAGSIGSRAVLMPECALLTQEKERLKKEKEAAEAKFKFALVDGRKEQARPHP